MSINRGPHGALEIPRSQSQACMVRTLLDSDTDCEEGPQGLRVETGTKLVASTSLFSLLQAQPTSPRSEDKQVAPVQG